MLCFELAIARYTDTSVVPVPAEYPSTIFRWVFAKRSENIVPTKVKFGAKKYTMRPLWLAKFGYNRRNGASKPTRTEEPKKFLDFVKITVFSPLDSLSRHN